MNTKVCQSCGYVGKPIHDKYSTFVIDILAWASWFTIGFITMIYPLMIVGPLFTIFHLSIFYTKKCPKCGNLEMVGLHSHPGRLILQPHVGGLQPWTDERGSPAH